MALFMGSKNTKLLEHKPMSHHELDERSCPVDWQAFLYWLAESEKAVTD